MCINILRIYLQEKMQKIDKNLLRESQLKMLELLMEVDKICKKYNINYWIDSGTLLGAVRHGGFIPWDDDIDVCMLEKDYKYFLKVAEKELDSNRYFISNKNTDSKVLFNFSKIRDRNSTFIEKDETDKELYHQGVFIDIFCVSYIKNYNKTTARWYVLLKKIKDIIPERGNKTALKYIIKKIGFSALASYIYEKVFISENVTKIIDYKYNFMSIKELDTVFPLKKIRFENHFFFCPNDNDIYLKILYGNYMKLPKEDDRVWHAKYIDLNKKCYFEEVMLKVK